MSVIQAAIRAVAKRRRGATENDPTGRDVRPEHEQSPSCGGEPLLAEASAAPPEAAFRENSPYFEFSCYHASGLCLIRGEGH